MRKVLKNLEKYDVYKLFGVLPILSAVGNSGHVLYKLFGFLPIFLIKYRETRKLIYLFGILLLKIKKNFNQNNKLPTNNNNMPPEVSIHLQDTKNPVGRVMLVFHMDFLRKDCGCSNYVYETARLLKKQGYAIDFFSADLWGTAVFDKFVELNKREKLIDNFYFSNYKKAEGYTASDEVCLADINWINGFIRNFFEKLMIKNKYDYIYIHYIQWADLLKNRANLFPETKAVYNCQDSNFNQKFLNTKGDLSIKSRIVADAFEYELRSFDLFDKILCISYDEMLFWKKFLPDREFYFVPHPLKEIKHDKSEKNIDLLYLAAYNPYNLHGLEWFVDKVLPFITNKINITVCGKLVQFLKSNDPEYIKKLEILGFNLIDFADDLNELYSKVKAAIVPLYEGTGMKIKTIEAMSHNIPIVSRLPGVDGFPDKTNSGILVTDNPKLFADNIMHLLTDEDFYKSVKEQEHEYFNKLFDKKHVQNVMKEVFVVSEK